MMETEKVKCLIVGSGPAGYTAAIYAGRANLSPVLYAGLQPGGQLTTTTDVENFPGYPQGIGGPELMEDLRKQAERFGADLRYGVATAANLAEAPYKITIDDEKMIEAETLIIATGAAAKYLGLEDEKKYAGMGGWLKKNVLDYIEHIPLKTAKDVSQEIKWCEKMLLRTMRGDVEGYYRWHWLLCDSLEIYFDIKGIHYYGPKKALHFMEESDSEAFHIYSKALLEFNQEGLSDWINYLKTIF